MKSFISKRSAAINILSTAGNPAAETHLSHSGMQELDYLKDGFTKAQAWYIKYGTMTSSLLYDEMFKKMEISKATRIFEAGSGPGNGIELMLPEVSEKCQIVASDINNEFLSLIKSYNWRNVDVIEANFQDLPLEDATFDRFISNMALHNAGNPVKPLAEAYRILSKGGIMGATVFGNRSNTYNQLMNTFRQFTGMPYHKSIVKNLVLMGEPESFKELAKEAGFQQAEVYGVQADYPYETADDAMDLFMSFEFFKGWMANNLNKADDFRELVHSELKKCIEVEGKLVGYEAQMLIAKKI